MVDRTKVYNVDCMEGMKITEDKFYELAIVDVPYGIDFANRGDGSGRLTKHNWKNHSRKQWDKETPDGEYFRELYRVSKNQIIWGANYLVDYLESSMGWIFWDKGQRDFSLADGELAYSSFKRALRVFDYTRGEQMAVDRGNRIHPTQKPVALYKWLLKNYAKPGDKILDPHLGSGSSRIAAFDMGFDFTGYELDKDYFEASEKRFKQHKAQLKLFPVTP